MKWFEAEEGLYISFERTATLPGWARCRRDQESVFLLQEGGYRLSSCHVHATRSKDGCTTRVILDIRRLKGLNLQVSHLGYWGLRVISFNLSGFTLLSSRPFPLYPSSNPLSVIAKCVHDLESHVRTP